MGDVVKFSIIDKLRKRSKAHASLMEVLEGPPCLSVEASASDWADLIMELLWQEGFKIVPRDDDGGSAA